ncbi:putative UPF0481 protein At3g02645 [Fagus crenata]
MSTTSRHDYNSPDVWVRAINKIFNNNTPFRIGAFIVPDSLRDSKLEAYFPQVVGLGPLHHSRLKVQLMHMHIYKLGVVRKIHHKFGQNSFGEFVRELRRVVPSVRECYPRHLDAHDFHISYIMAIDGLFLLVLLLHDYGIRNESNDGILQNIDTSDILGGLVKNEGTREGILRDTMMLENQIPMLVLDYISRTKLTYAIVGGSIENLLPQMLLGYCKALSPLDVLEDYPASIALKHAHLLEFLYHLIMLTEPPKPPQEDFDAEQEYGGRPGGPPEEEYDGGVSVNVMMALPDLLSLAELLKGLVELPWSKLFNPSDKAPVEKEILIPTASKLCSVGVQFVRTNHVTATEFEVEGDPVSFKLPFIKLNANTEVIIRNLVAYEQISKLESESLVLTRFFEMMNGIIETEEDVKVLKYHGILRIESMKDDEVVKIFSGMSKSVRLANPPNIDKAIEEANKYYNGQLDVMIRKFIKKCLSPSRNIIRKFWAAFVLIILAYEVYCSVYGCASKCKKSN